MLTVKRNSTGPYIFTICGSLRFTPQMLMAHHDLSSQGYLVFLPDINITKIPIGSSPVNEDAQTLHDAKISLGDGIYVMNWDNYIGESTFREIELARKLGKDIRWYCNKDGKGEIPSDETALLIEAFEKKGGVK